MDIRIEPASEEIRAELATWRYPPPYNFYNGDIEPMLKRDFATLGAWAFPDDWTEIDDAPRAFYGRWTRYEARLKSAATASYRERTWFIDGVALSVRLPWLAALHVGAPRRWRRPWGFVRRPGAL